MALSVEQKILIEQRIANDGKSTLVAYILWFFFYGLGAHRFYLGYTKSAFAILLLSVIGLILAAWGTYAMHTTIHDTLDTTASLVFLTGFALLGLVFLWAIIDAFLIPGMVRNNRNKLREQLTKYYKKS